MTRSIVKAISTSLLLFAASSAFAQSESWLSDATDQVQQIYDGQSALVIGELHGNWETPTLVASLVTRLADIGPVTIALEIPRQEEQRIHAFLWSDGSQSAKSRLLAGDFWQVPAAESDGRRSKAMLMLLDTARELLSKDRVISVVTLDDVAFNSEDVDRRQGMADRINGLDRALEQGPVLVLLGNFHARLTPFAGMLLSDGQPIEPPRPTASLVSDLPLTSLNISACSGATWSCRAGKCGPVALAIQCENQKRAELRELDPESDGYHYNLTLPELTPSAPAR